MQQTAIPEPPGFAELSKAEQVRYLQELWDRIAERPGELPVPESHLSVEYALVVVGVLGLATGITTIFASAWAYAAVRDFSLLTTYISDFGAGEGWPKAIFTSGMLIAAPLRYLFLFLLLTQLVRLGASARFRATMLVVGALAVLGSIGTASVPYTLHMPIHKGSALLYFFGTVVLQTAIAIQEWRLRLPALLPLTSVAVVASYLVFATLLSLTDRVAGIDRTTPVPWEWLSFAALMIWLAVHTQALAPPRRKAG